MARAEGGRRGQREGPPGLVRLGLDGTARSKVNPRRRGSGLSCAALRPTSTNNLLVGILGLTLFGCAGPNWSAGAGLLAPEQDVAEALGETSRAMEPFDPASLPDIGQPTSTRPCCGFGMDLGIAVGGARVYTIPNIKSVEELGQHGYDNGTITFDLDLTHFATVEDDGLVYTCRGGFIDTAHVRDYADLTVFVALHLVAALPGPVVLTLPGDGAIRHVRLKALPADTMTEADRWDWAVSLAQYAVFQLSVFHELATWFGHRTTPSWSERASAFSPEDLYSNLLGIRIAGGIIRKQGVRSRRDWDASMDAWMPRALHRLGALPRKLGRRAMQDVDGVWWDSKKLLPDMLTVTRRNYALTNPLAPWRLEDAGVDSVIEAACAGTRALPLPIPERLAPGLAITEYLSVDFELGDWAPKDFPYREAGTRLVEASEFPRLVQAAQAEGEQLLGVGFARPGGKVVRPPSTQKR